MNVYLHDPEKPFVIISLTSIGRALASPGLLSDRDTPENKRKRGHTKSAWKRTVETCRTLGPYSQEATLQLAKDRHK